MKYVVIEVQAKAGEVHIPFLFPDVAVHADVSEKMCQMLEEQFKCPCRPVAAGFASSMSFVGAGCYGKSESLNLKAKPRSDTDLIRMCDYGSIHMYKG